MKSLILPQWPQPSSVKSCSTTRSGGVSVPPYNSLNLGAHVGDNPADVEQNRQQLITQAALPQAPQWLEQVHGTRVLRLTGEPAADIQADAVYSNVPGQVCAVMTADCLPVLFCSLSGDEVAATHAGWRGLCAGVLEQTLAEFSAKPSSIIAWLGPAIGPRQFEVGAEVKQAFVSADPQAALAFTPFGDKYLADIYLLARQRLESAGIHAVYGGDLCTVSDEQQFFSYRREGITGRLASLIWLI
ncbi:purine nucleoside phosphorylase YfiH [Yersinia nurmii]|uniref:Purine nucleoside phosphorylase n=1 Tax=Yersinia nurmii TaxID=685706 RepID=A0AAW7K3T8_9GAMM|nr:purine nucleoside phosphorylase YfiH [Yersinia nurmii]MDN0089328.1 purine nucleoside phosphorylase YfiH [Yersinia nurmii]CNF05514.1 inner membrane protein [Yersinia nurmii]